MQKRTWVYVVYTEKPGYVYVGQSKWIKDRLKNHRTGKGSKFTKVHGYLHAVVVLDPTLTEKQLCRDVKAAHPDWVVCGWRWLGKPFTPVDPNEEWNSSDHKMQMDIYYATKMR